MYVYIYINMMPDISYLRTDSQSVSLDFADLERACDAYIGLFGCPYFSDRSHLFYVASCSFSCTHL